MKKRYKFTLAIVAIVIFTFLSSFNKIINFATDYMWFKELGYTKTFLTKLMTQLKIGIPAFFIFFLLIMLYVITLKKGYYREVHIIPEKKGEKKLNFLLVLLSAVVSLFVSSSIAGNLWFDILQYINAVKFNTNDPIFGNDISFYVFKLPLITEILNIILFLAFVLIIITVLLYLILFIIRRPNEDGPIYFDGRVNSQDFYGLIRGRLLNQLLIKVGIIGLVFFLIIGVNYIIRSYGLLYSARGKVFGAGYTDIHVSLWVYRLMAIIAVLSSVGVLFGAVRKNIKLALTGPVVLIAVSILGNIAAGAVEKFIVEPDQISKESKYLEYNIEYTQKAYGLDKVELRDFVVEQNLTKEDLLENEETIKNIRINDYRPIKQVYFQLQGIRPYYRFNDIDIDRYNINGEYTQVFLSARELDQDKLDNQAKTWINLYLKYTHGYGFTMSPVNTVTKEGQPVLLVKDIPPVTDTDIKIERPEIYFGELTNNYIIVNTDENEFDYPQGEDNKETIYKGTAGIKLGGLNKLLFAIKEKSLKLLISNNINPDSRIVLYRNINERIRKIAPFIQYDSDPYLVVNQEDGKLYWIIDGYTLSTRYPYSQPYKDSNVNYIRNPVKVVVDAYNGDTKFYIVDELEPIIMTYKNIFPDLFLSIDDMPNGIREHIRYPRDLFDIQAEIYRIYHMNNPEVFFAREDYWAIAKEKYMEQIQNVESNYVMFKLPEEERTEFLLAVPYTPNNKNNMTALFIARNDGDNYGELVLYKFPKNENIPGPMMIESRIDQDSNISPQLTLWSQKGSNVLRGNVLVIPIENSLLYIEPIYLKADNENSLPEMKRVVVAYQDKIVMEETLDEALSRIFGDIRQEVDDDNIVDDVETDIMEGDIEELIKNANDVFNKAKEASQNGDWAKYGEYINQLEDILNQLNTTFTPEENQ